MSLACVLPGLGSGNPEIVESPTISAISTEIPLPTILPTDEISCQTKEESPIIAVVMASPDGGLNIRNLPIEMGGIILATARDGDEMEVFNIDIGNGWSEIRYYVPTISKYICGYVNRDFIKIKNTSQKTG